MAFEKGQQVVINRNLGEKRGYGRSHYYYGDRLRNAPLGSKAVVSDVLPNKIVVRLSNNNLVYDMHPEELRSDEERLLLREEQQKGLNALLTDDSSKVPVKESVIPGKFYPKFNVREEFAVWMKQEFPYLKFFAKTGTIPYVPLLKRKQEVLDAAELAYQHGESTLKSCALYDFNTIYGTLKGERSDYITYGDFATRSHSFATRVEKFVSFIEFLSLNLDSVSSKGYVKHHGTKRADAFNL